MKLHFEFSLAIISRDFFSRAFSLIMNEKALIERKKIS